MAIANLVDVTSNMVTEASARAYLDQLDCGYIIDAMCAESYPLPRWTREDATHCCKIYKNYLWLIKIHPNATLVPTREIDEFWHNHILYTKRYTDDCQQIFGYYLHHNPLSPNEDTTKLIREFSLTKQLYLETFNEAL